VAFAFHRAAITKRVRPQQRAVFTEAERLEREMVRAILDEIRALQGSVKLQEIAQVLDVASPDEVLQLLNAQGTAGIGVSLEPKIVDGAAAGAKIAAKELGKVVVLDMRRPHFQRWLKDHMGELIKQTTGTSMRALRATLTDGINRGRHPMRLAKDLKQSIGLTEPHAKAVDKLRAKLEADGVSAARADKQVERYRQKLLRHRARNIARTESMQSLSHGRQALWEQLTADDAWPGDKPPKKSWLTSEDEATCPICAPMNNVTVEINETWSIGEPAFAHPSCRCTASLVDQ